MPGRVLVSPGDRYGNLTIVNEVPAINFDTRRGSPLRRFAWRCSCSAVGESDLAALRKGEATSCGCRRAEFCRTLGLNSAKHGFTKGKRSHRLYRVWSTMKERCHNPSSHKFPIYGARGIYVCDEWRHSSAAFLEWATANGWAVGLQIDRIDNDGPYSPANCRFVTPKENSANRRPARRLSNS